MVAIIVIVVLLLVIYLVLLARYHASRKKYEAELKKRKALEARRAETPQPVQSQAERDYFDEFFGKK